MIACIDVQYSESEATRPHAYAAIVAFDSWRSSVPTEHHVIAIQDVAPYESGAFYKRELPCILAALETLTQTPDIVIVDGYVWLGEDRPGLGAKLYEARSDLQAVVGVAKTHFTGTTADPVVRGDSKRPLWVSEIGREPLHAALRVAEMHGAFRLPTMLRLVDQLCRGRVTVH